VIECEAGCCRISGAVTVDTTGSLLRALQPQLAEGVRTLDFSGVKVADSAALALIFSAMREVRRAGGTLVCTGLPASVPTLAALYGVAELLPA